MKLKIYAYYGLLAHEKEPVYSYSRVSGELCEEITVEIPANVDMWTNDAVEPVFRLPGGCVCLASECLSSWGGSPALRWYDGNTEKRVVLRIAGKGAER